MANQIIKKDGSKEPFNVEKIKKGIRLAGQVVIKSFLSVCFKRKIIFLMWQ
jgi:transcriptional regulator NrdR family protein